MAKELEVGSNQKYQPGVRRFELQILVVRLPITRILKQVQHDCCDIGILKCKFSMTIYGKFYLPLNPAFLFSRNAFTPSL